MGVFAWIKLKILEERLGFEFGKLNKYRCLCLEQEARRAKDKLRIARQVWDGPGVTVLEAWCYAITLRKRGIHRPARHP